MAHYRCYFLGSSGQLLGAETIDAAGDDEALTQARRLFATKVFAVGYELRRGDRVLCIEWAKAS